MDGVVTVEVLAEVQLLDIPGYGVEEPVPLRLRRWTIFSGLSGPPEESREREGPLKRRTSMLSLTWRKDRAKSLSCGLLATGTGRRSL